MKWWGLSKDTSTFFEFLKVPSKKLFMLPKNSWNHYCTTVQKSENKQGGRNKNEWMPSLMRKEWIKKKEEVCLQLDFNEFSLELADPSLKRAQGQKSGHGRKNYYCIKAVKGKFW